MKAIKTQSLTLLFFIGFVIPVIAQKPIPYGDNPAVGKYIELNGVKHYYEAYGNGTPLLLVHGNRTGIKGWAPQIEYFAKKYKVYAIDCRGRGKSELGNDSLTYIQQAADMSAFLKAMNVDSACVVGKSDGGIVALLMGIYYPERVKKMVAFAPNLWLDSFAQYPESVKEIHDERVHAEKMLAAKDTTDNWHLIVQRYRLMEFQPNIKASDLKKINVPVLVMSCDRDLIQEEHILLIYRSIPRASLAILTGETHHVPRQNPELFNATVDKFLAAPFEGREKRFKK